MNTENKKRVRDRSPVHDRAVKKGKLPAAEIPDLFFDDSGKVLQNPGTHRPLGVFEFPWQNENGTFEPELDGCSHRDVFFSSLVDGISLLTPSLIAIPGEAEEFFPSVRNADGVDCIWNSALHQPLSATFNKTPSA